MKVALTGGIGSGKSYVCRLLEKRGIRIYDCDAAAKRLLRSSKDMQKDIRQLVGEEVYVDNVLQKKVLARFVTASDANAQAVNNIVHPAVADDFEKSDYQWLESAIFFDSGFNKRVHIDKVVCVTAPDELRIKRVMKRDGITRDRAEAWLRCQLPQEVVAELSDYTIVNDGNSDLETQIDNTLKQIENL